MKLLILSCNTGAGHNSVASALKEVFSDKGDECEIVDALSFLPPGWSQIASDMHSYIYKKAPELFRKGYEHAENHRSQFEQGHATRNLIDVGVSKLGRFIKKTGGISTTEAAIKGVPMVFVDAVGGCEQYNMDYFLSYGGAVTEKTIFGLVQAALWIISNRQCQMSMREQLRKAVAENNREIITDVFSQKSEKAAGI